MRYDCFQKVTNQGQAMPDDVYRHSIPELITRYQFEPTLRGIYVKGQRDQTFLRWFFLRSGMENTVAYEISIINIPDDLVARLGVAGNRGRVIALCVELDRAADIAIDSVRGLIDKEFFDILQEPHDARFLLKTDFSCMECYALDIGTLKKFSLIYLGREISSEHLEKLLAIIAEICVLRAAKQQLEPRAG